MVVYANASGLVLPSTPGDQTQTILDALSKLDAMINTIENLTQNFIPDTELSEDFTTTFAFFRDNTSKILADTAVLGDTLTKTFTTLNDSLDNPTDAKNLFEGLYSFGDEDPVIDPTTFELTERKDNQDILNGSIQTMALLMNYQNVPSIDFLTVDEIDTERAELDDQFNEIFQFKSINQNDNSDLLDARNFIRQFFDAEALQAFKITSVFTHDTPITELTFRYYGSLDNTQTLIDINGFKDLSHIEGDVQILTK